MKKFKIYIIDFDGTLIDSYQALPIFYRHAFGSLGYEVSDEEAFYYTKISLQQAFKEKVNNDDLVDEFKKACYAIIDTKVLLPYNIPFEDSYIFINYIKDNKLPCALVTGNSLKHVNMVLDDRNINDFLNLKITSEELKNQKPDPEGILLALDKLNYQGDKKDVCYIGDAYNDALAAIRAGVTPILIDRFNQYEEKDGITIIHSLNELIN